MREAHQLVGLSEHVFLCEAVFSRMLTLVDTLSNYGERIKISGHTVYVKHKHGVADKDKWTR